MLFLDNIPDLTPLEYEIYHFIAKNIEMVTFMRIRDLAKNTHTSTASISRFCHKFECSGFSEFKVKLRLYHENRILPSIVAIDEQQYIHFLERVSQPYLESKIDQAVDILSDKSLVLFLGSGSSEPIAAYGTLFFTNLSQTALRIEDPSNYPIEWFSEVILERTCVIVLSVSGETKELLHYVKRLNVKKCPIISITNNEDSTISLLSTVNIPYMISRETFKKANEQKDKAIELTSQLPALFIVEKLAKKLNLKKKMQRK